MAEVKENSTPLSAPYHFARCLNAQCPKAENCLRQIAAQYDTNNYPYITIVNPTCLPADTTDCAYFKSAQKIRVAWGVKHLLDKVPYKSAVSLRQQLVGHFGKSAYYRFHREERHLSPEDQVYIRRLFRQKGVNEEPAFSRYTEEYNW